MDAHLTEKWPGVHKAVCSCKRLYGDGAPSWKHLPASAEARQRSRANIKLLRSARRPRKYPLSDEAWAHRKEAFGRLARKLEGCRGRNRCGSLACSKCRRAFARAQYAAMRRAIRRHRKKH